ncbi:vitamin K epoxide reductase family protein [Sphingobacterium bambusae]|uniref:Vitamin K epoxide reductase family protein n=1 Tax=Sphingobacterium bambusae TaxID=662858 RepID=A0ABW6B8N8_9SPHI|nr:vitamin K epoxide reductase family protein [Sphingobacterium bambusae]WPL49150.1 vitamin K epoxide reductase family protein [Sphingobacterium bambusae]
MFHILKYLRKEKYNSYVVLKAILKHFNIKFTDMGVDQLLNQHVEFTSLLAIKEVLLQYGVQSEAIKKGNFDYADFQTPFVCLIQQDEWPSPMFTIVKDADENSITYLHPINGRNLTVDVSQFENFANEVILLLDGEHAKDEVNYYLHKRHQLRDKSLRKLSYLLFFAPVFLVGFQLCISGNSSLNSWVSFLFILASFIGFGASLLLMWYEIDAHNPFLQEVCGGSRNSDRNRSCNAVLNSKSSNFLGISWSVWGGAYFASFYLIQILYPGLQSQLAFWSTVSLLASPFIIYSLYYQGYIIKQWCPLCLTVQVVLLINTSVSLVYLLTDNTLHIDWYLITVTLLFGSSFLTASHLMIPVLKKAKDSRRYEIQWKKMRHNADIFHWLLQKSKSIIAPVENIGIVIGNPTAKHEIIKVCNPYCDPCARIHLTLKEITQHNTNVKLRIIFTASGDGNDRKTAPVSHLLAIEESLGSKVVQQALEEWYLTEEKKYEAFAEKYPMNGKLNQQGAKIKRMFKWCKDMEIRATPTIYINGNELPESYQVAELKHILLD